MKLAQLAHILVGVVACLADGGARTYGRDAVSQEITDDTAYLEKVPRRIPIRGNFRASRTGVWRARRRDQVGQAEGTTWWP